MQATTAPTTKVTGSVIAIAGPYDNRTVHFNRDRLTTAYLLLLDAWRDEVPNPGRVVCEALERDHGVEHREAMRCTIAASLLARHNIEP